MLKFENGYIDFNNGFSKCSLEYAIETPKEACKKVKEIFPILKMIVDSYGDNNFRIETVEEVFDAFDVSFEDKAVDYQWFKENE